MSAINRDERGTWHWVAAVDRTYERKAFRIAFGVCGGICLLFILMSLLMDAEMLWVTLLSGLGVMAVVGGVCLLFEHSAGKRTQGYLMTEDAVSFRRPRQIVPFPFRSIRKAVVVPSRDMIELYQAVGSGPVFVPHGDFEFVRDFILERLPDTAEIRYE